MKSLETTFMLAVIFGILKSCDKKIQYFPAFVKFRVNFVFNIKPKRDYGILLAIEEGCCTP